MKDLVGRFMENVRLIPDHPAVVHKSASISYGVMGTLTARIAAAIANISDNSRVIVYLPKGAIVVTPYARVGKRCKINADIQIGP